MYESFVRMTIFATGGTFDKEYNKITGELYFKDNRLRKFLDSGCSPLNINIKKLMLIDSLQMATKDQAVDFFKFNYLKK